ncbi:MAG: transporter substrate-binding protein, partial [Geminicoccaceae bacterium]|nr:transporter substrate-binding protein [Geminicoccaceae bacterium]
MYETLTVIDADLSLRPVLATSWQLIDPTRWRFELRQGVSFHDGTPLSAGDAVFSIERARAEGSELATYTSSIAAVTAVDDDTVEIATRHPDMLLPVNLRQIAILSKAWAERHGIANARPYAQGAPPLDHANGTGPFMLESHETGRRTVLVRNPHWWGSAEFPHNLDRIVWSIVPGPKERLALLLSGQTDFIQDPPLEALSSIRSRRGLRLAETGELRVLLLGMNQGTPELHSGDVAGANPFKDKRVRQALYQAIDIDAIRDDVMAGLAIPTAITVPPGVNGYAPELDQRLPYDLERAKALLAEAGYAEGFGVTLDCPNNRNLNDEAICRAVAFQLGAIGIRVKVDAQPKEVHFAKLFERRTDFYLLGYLTPSFDSALHLRELYHSQAGRWGATGYANPALDALIERVDATLITYARDALIEEAWRIILGDVIVIPLHRQMI